VPASNVMMDDRFLKRLHKKARKGHRGWPIATIAFYGPNLNQATKVVVGIVTSENAQAEPLRDWKVDRGDIRADAAVAREILEFIGGPIEGRPMNLEDQMKKSRIDLEAAIAPAPHKFTPELLIMYRGWGSDVADLFS